ncbi:hypothetical protein ABW19_dt0205702 [Dactylella cylindrospora]|nr:hypothetical protein ABW19_dt0205702 [Dactylella cylindrospora]
MSGLEVGALVIALFGAGAGSVSAYKDMRNRKIQSEVTTWNNGSSSYKRERLCFSQGDGTAIVTTGGDLIAQSGNGGMAIAVDSRSQGSSWSTSEKGKGK